jgi:hypothetical protein
LLAQGLDIRYGQVVTSVTQSTTTPRSVTVAVAGGASYKAAYAVVTLPLGVLKAKKVVFSPALSAAKAGASSRIGFGTLDKVAMVFPSAFWSSATTDFEINRLPPKGQERQVGGGGGGEGGRRLEAWCRRGKGNGQAPLLRTAHQLLPSHEWLLSAAGHRSGSSTSSWRA